MARATQRALPDQLPIEAEVSYRAMLFRRPLGPWQPRRVLAIQDAVRAGEGSRCWLTGKTFTQGAVQIADRPIKLPISIAQQRLAQALSFHHRHGSAALVRASTKLADAHADAIAEEIDLWAEIVEELKGIRAEALRAERPRWGSLSP